MLEKNKDLNPVDVDNFLEYNFDKNIESWMQKTHEFHDIEYDSIINYFSSIREKYLEAHEELEGIDKEKLLNKYKRHIFDVRSRFDDSIELRDHLSLVNNSPEQHGNSWMDFKKSKVGQEIGQTMSGGKGLTWQGDTAGYIINGNFMSTYDIRKMIDENTFDLPSKNLIDGVVEYAQVLASQKGAGDINMKEIEFKIKNEVIKKGNRNSLINDSHIQTEGGSFKGDMINRLQEMQYKDLGVSGDGLISGEAARLITNKLLKDKDLTDEYLAKYSQHVKNQYDFVKPYTPQAQMTDAQYNEMLKNKNAYGEGSSTPQTQQAAERYKQGSL